jgi:hypothetical protein
MRTFILSMVAALACGDQAIACWACNAGPDEECYFEDYWAPEEELAQMSAAAGSCGPGGEASRMSASTGAVFSLECEGGKVRYRQLAPDHVIKVRPLSADMPRSEAGRLPQAEAERLAEAERALATCDRGPNSPACNEAHAAMMAKARQLVYAAGSSGKSPSDSLTK